MNLSYFLHSCTAIAAPISVGTITAIETKEAISSPPRQYRAMYNPQVAPTLSRLLIRGAAKKINRYLLERRHSTISRSV